MGKRRRSRELALQTLYALDFRADDVSDKQAVGQAIAAMRGLASEPAHDDEDLRLMVRGGDAVQDFATTLVRGVAAHLVEIDELLGHCSTNWKVARMAKVDRNILRMATYELRYLGDIPPRVTLNEAVEIAKRYGSEDSGAFINGILDRIASLAPID